MTKKKRKDVILTEIFYDKNAAEKAYERAISRGYNIKEIIGVLQKNKPKFMNKVLKPAEL